MLKKLKEAIFREVASISSVRTLRIILVFIRSIKKD